ncbi:MAG: biotin--[acetyl-CoA-carboxylase] ligase [Armatimonadetes bacterium]|nr:biotin--[acetyl-CoA-carboxylase] ligase [Armatimonadota bacterium]
MSGIDLQRVSAQLRGRRLRGPLIFHSQTTSTNDDAKALAAAGAAEGTVVIAGEQTQGRGRYQRSWFGHPDYALLFSLILRPTLLVEQLPRLVNTIGVGVAEGCAAAARRAVGTKWPNDIIVDELKVGGILIEALEPGYAVAGVGLNVLGGNASLPPELREIAATLAAASAVPLTREDVLASVLNAVDHWYDVLLREQWEEVVARQRELETTLGQERTVLVGGTEITGTVRDLAPDGGLMLDTPEGLRTITVGEVI